MACNRSTIRTAGRACALAAGFAVLAGCSTPEPANDPAKRFREIAVVAPADTPPPSSADNPARASLERGHYLLDLLGCASCHTNGALLGAPEWDKPLAGSSVGIAIESPLQHDHPAVVYPPNLTPDSATGLGDWAAADIATAIRGGVDREGRLLHPAMPWQGFSRLSREDALAIADYLLSLPALANTVPENVPPGTPARYPFVYFGIYQSVE